MRKNISSRQQKWSATSLMHFRRVYIELQTYWFVVGGELGGSVNVKLLCNLNYGFLAFLAPPSGNVLVQNLCLPDFFFFFFFLMLLRISGCFTVLVHLKISCHIAVWFSTCLQKRVTWWPFKNTNTKPHSRTTVREVLILILWTKLDVIQQITQFHYLLGKKSQFSSLIVWLHTLTIIWLLTVRN